MDNATMVRIERRSASEVSAFGRHLRREGDEPHVDPGRTHLNHRIVGTADPMSDLRSMREASGVRPTHWGGGKPCDAVELLFTASPAWFRPNGEGKGRWCPKRVRAFASAMTAFLDRFFNGRVVSARIDLDEETPHGHVLVLPWVERVTKLGKKIREVSWQKGIVRGRGRGSFSWWQDQWGLAVEHIGLVRGERGSEAKHKRPAKYKAEMYSELCEEKAKVAALEAEIALLRKREAEAKARAALAAERSRQDEAKDAEIEAALESMGFAEGRRADRQRVRGAAA